MIDSSASPLRYRSAWSDFGRPIFDLFLSVGQPDPLFRTQVKIMYLVGSLSFFFGLASWFSGVFGRHCSLIVPIVLSLPARCTTVTESLQYDFRHSSNSHKIFRCTVPDPISVETKWFRGVASERG